MLTRIPHWLFPALLLVLQLAASARYAAGGDWRKTIYWADGGRDVVTSHLGAHR